MASNLLLPIPRCRHLHRHKNLWRQKWTTISAASRLTTQVSLVPLQIVHGRKRDRARVRELSPPAHAPMKSLLRPRAETAVPCCECINEPSSLTSLDLLRKLHPRPFYCPVVSTPFVNAALLTSIYTPHRVAMHLHVLRCSIIWQNAFLYRSASVMGSSSSEEDVYSCPKHIYN